MPEDVLNRGNILKYSMNIYDLISKVLRKNMPKYIVI